MDSTSTHTPDRSREQEWIAKYRAALDAFPTEQQQSHFQGVSLSWDRVGNWFKVAFRIFCKVDRATSQAGSNQSEMAADIARLPIVSGQSKMSVQSEQFPYSKNEARKVS